MTRGLLLAFLLVGLIVTTASANPQTTLDRDDTAGPLDLVAAKQSESFTAQTHPNRSWMVLDMKLVTFEAWTDADLDDPFNFLGFELNLDDDDNIERCVLIKQSESESGLPRSRRPPTGAARTCRADRWGSRSACAGPTTTQSCYPFADAS